MSSSLVNRSLSFWFSENASSSSSSPVACRNSNNTAVIIGNLAAECSARVIFDPPSCYVACDSMNSSNAITDLSNNNATSMSPFNNNDHNVCSNFWTCPPAPLEKWAFGLLFSFIVSICAVLGAFLLPMMQKPYFERVLNGLIGLAVGCLSSSAVFHLIPECFEFSRLVTHEQEVALLGKGCFIMGGIYLFFLSERCMKIYAEHCKRKKARMREREAVATARATTKSNAEGGGDDEEQFTTTPHDGSYYSQAPIIVSDCHHHHHRDSIDHHDHDAVKVSDAVACLHDVYGEQKNGMLPTSKDIAASYPLHPVSADRHRTTSKSIRRYADEQPCKTHEHDHGIERDDVKKRPIRTVAWMVIAGDGLHNFIDGLGMGAAFSTSILSGISLSVAVLCEELPHELGDLAILINSGMSLKKALFYNFMSAIICILGLCCGLILGEIGGTYIFAIAAGAFLYISLVDMFPEMTHTTEAASKKGLKDGLIMLFIQNVGLLSGVVVMYLMARYGKHIEDWGKVASGGGTRTPSGAVVLAVNNNNNNY